MDESAFIQNVAVMTVLAGLVAVIFAKFKWPKVLGYIGIGILMNKHTWGGSFLVHEETVQVIGQLGIIYLMLLMGLGFSASEVKKMKSVTMPIAILDTIVMVWLGYTVGTRLLGWGTMPSLFLGVAICDSATTMLAKVIDEMKWGGRTFVRYALGTSVCEDIICVALIAVITGVANGQGISLLAAGTSLGGLFVFFLAVIVFGLILIPRLLVSVAKTHDNEALLLAFIGCCCFVSWVALKLNYSLALGAFLVGILGAASDAHKRLNELISPLVSTHAAVFFISIGLFVNPMACLNNLLPILVLTVVVLVGKFVNCTVGALLTGQSVKTAIQIGMSLAQIGEFALMVSVLYVGLTGDEACPMFPVVVAVSILTTLLNPIMIRGSVPLGEWIERHLPKSSRQQLDTYRGFVAKVQSADHNIMFHSIIRTGFIQLGVVGALNFAVAVAFSLLSARDWSDFSAFFNDNKRFIFCLLANLFMVAMLVPTLRIARSLGHAFATVIIGPEDTKWQSALRHVIALAVNIGVLVLLFCEVSMVNVNLAPDEIWARWTIRGILLTTAVFGWKFFVKAVDRASVRFQEALQAEERRANIVEKITFTLPEDHISRLTLDASSPAIGATVVSLNIRAKTGATIVSVERGDTIMRTIDPKMEFQVGDTLLAVGERAQIAALKDLLGIVSQR